MCRNCPEETECIRLRKQLQDLQQNNYKKQMKYKDRNQSSTRDMGVARHTPHPDTYTNSNHHGNRQRGISEDFSDDVTLNEEELASLEVAELTVFDSNDEEERGMEHDTTVHPRGDTQRNWTSEKRNFRETFYN